MVELKPKLKLAELFQNSPGHLAVWKQFLASRFWREREIQAKKNAVVKKKNMFKNEPTELKLKEFYLLKKMKVNSKEVDRLNGFRKDSPDLKLAG